MIDLNIANPYQQAVQLDSSPFTQYYIQNQAHELARNEALQQHMDGLAKDALTNKKLRPQEEDEFLGQINKWKNYVIQNKRDYRRGGEAKRIADNMYGSALSYANQSSAAREDDNKIFELKKDKNSWDRITPEDMTSFDKSQLPVGKGYEPVNWSKFHLGATPFDLKSDEQLYNFATKDIKPPTTIVSTRVNSKDKSQLIDLHETKYNNEGLNGIGDIYARAYNNDESFKSKIATLRKSLMPTPNRFDPTKLDVPPEAEAYNTAFKNVTGRDISSDADLAKAYGIVQAGNKVTREEKTRDNYEYKRSADMQDYRTKSQISADKEVTVARTKKRLGLNSTADDTKINDAYGRIDAAINKGESKRLSDMNLDANDVATVMNIAKNSLPASRNASPDVMKIEKDNNGVSHLYLDDGSDTKISLGALSSFGVNSKANPKDKKTRNKLLSASPSSSGMVRFEHEGKTYELSEDNYAKMEAEAKKSGAKIKRLP